MPPSTLYELGWRQGATVSGALPLLGVTSSDGEPQVGTTSHDFWIVASQDCDLSGYLEDDNEASIELRPIFSSDQRANLGVRSRTFYIGLGDFVHADRPRTHVSPALLATLSPASLLLPWRALGFKTWLGLRYDRPAVPTALVELAKSIGQELRSVFEGPLGTQIWDVLVEYSPGSTRVDYGLVAIVGDAADRERIQATLSEAALRVPVQLGQCTAIKVGGKGDISLDLLENSYSADLSQLTWGSRDPQLPST